MQRVLRTHLIFRRSLGTWENIIKSPVPNIHVSKNILLQQYCWENIKWTDKVALECIETKRKYTYVEVKEKSLSLAHFLKNSLKLVEKSCVGIILPNVPEFAIVFLACITAGLQVTTINPNYTKDEIKKQLAASNAKTLIGLAEREQELREICDNLNIPVIAVKTSQNATLHAGTINFSDCITLKQHDNIHTENITADDVVLLPFSSGTTGLPKGVQLTHYNLVSNLMQTGLEEFNLYKNGHDEIVLAFLPFFHIYGLMLVLLLGLCKGIKLITFPKFTSHHFIHSLRDYRPTFFPSVPPIIHLINTSPNIKPTEDLASLRAILCGAAPLTETDVVRFKDITKEKVDIFQAYGMTETSPVTVMQTKALENGIKIGGSGFLIPNTEAKFISTENSGDQNPLGAKQSGELSIRGPQVMKGYLNNPEATKEMLSNDGWIRTGDIGHYDEDGHIFITDRLKELIKVQGFPVAPVELESLLRDHPSVQDVAVVGVRHEKLGEVPRAFVVPRKNARVTTEDIQGFVAGKVVKYKHLVGGVVFLEEIPKTPSGKILRKELKKLV